MTELIFTRNCLLTVSGEKYLHQQEGFLDEKSKGSETAFYRIRSADISKQKSPQIFRLEAF